MKIGVAKIVIAKVILMQLFFTLLFVLVLGFTPHTLRAAENIKTITLKDGTQLNLNGIGRAKQLNDDYFLGALYLIEPFGNIDDITYINNPKRMEIRIAYKKISSRRFGQYWKEAIAINNPRNIWEPQVKNVLRFTRFFNQNLLKGDIINLDFLPDRGTFVFLNGILIGEIRNPSFFNLLLMTWLGNRPPNQQFKQGVMGAYGADDVDIAIKLQQSFEALKPSAKRKLNVLAKKNKAENSANEKKNNNKSKVVKKSKAKVTKTKGKKGNKNSLKPAVKKTKNTTLKLPVSRKKTSVKIVPKLSVAASAAAKITTKKKLKAKSQNKKKLKAVNSTKKNNAKKTKKVVAKVAPPKLSASARLKIFEARSNYGKLLRNKIRLHQAFPLKKMLRSRKYRKMMEKGAIRADGIIWVKIARDGSVLSSKMEQSTKIPLLDAAAIQMVEKADPLPAMPKLLEGKYFEFLVKIAFLSPKL